MDELHLPYGLTGVLAAALALISYKMRRLPLSEPMLALALGIVLGPQLLGLVDISDHVRDLVLLEGSRLVVALSVMAARCASRPPGWAGWCVRCFWSWRW